MLQMQLRMGGESGWAAKAAVVFLSHSAQIVSSRALSSIAGSREQT